MTVPPAEVPAVGAIEGIMCGFLTELLKALPGIVTAGTAVFGIYIAKAGLEKWHRETIGKRKIELAEEVLADFYQTRDIINSARSLASYSHEGSTRDKADWEDESDTSTLNSYYAVAERLYNRSEFFAQLHARRYRFMALFGKESAKPYDDLNKVYGKIIVAVRMLIRTYRKDGAGTTPENSHKWESVIWEGYDEEDMIPKELDLIVIKIEELCQPTINKILS